VHKPSSNAKRVKGRRNNTRRGRKEILKKGKGGAGRLHTTHSHPGGRQIEPSLNAVLETKKLKEQSRGPYKKKGILKVRNPK